MRKNGNSNRLAEAFAKGACDAGNTVKTIDCAKLNVKGCNVCNQCYKNGSACAQNDDFNIVAPYVEDADVIVFATPVYWFNFSAKLKAVIDKFYAFCTAKKDVAGKKCVLLACAGAEDVITGAGIIVTYHLIVDYLKWKNEGEICALGYNDPGDIENAHELREAERLGTSI